MKVMVIIKASRHSEAGELPDEKLLTDMGNFNAELVKAGIMLQGEGLQPSSKGVRVRFSGRERYVTNGPFAETKELTAGFWMWRVKSMDEAIEWVNKCPNPMNEDCEIEIRRVFEADDFGDSFTPELRQQEASLRAQTLGLGALRFESGPEVLIAGTRESYTLDSIGKIPAQWDHFVPYLGRIPGQVGNTAFGVCLTCNPVGGFDYLAGVEVTSATGLPTGFVTVHLSAQQYAVFTHPGHVSSISRSIDTIWKQWLPDSGLKAAQSPSFERYTEEFNPQTGTGGIEIWVPVQL